MKNYMFLQWCQLNRYRHISDYVSSLNLRFLVDFFSEDYRSDDKNLFIRVVNCYNAYFVFNNFKTHMMYIGFSEWEYSDGEEHAPSKEEFPEYINDANSCKISVDNFKELAQQWLAMKKVQFPFAIIYRDENDWIDCKGFNSQEEMELFVKNYQPQKVH